jgi:hypothetical protein
MRVRTKHFVILAVIVGVVQAWWTYSHRRPAEVEREIPQFPGLRAKAREVRATNATIGVTPVTNWSVQLGAVLSSDSSSTNQAISLLALFPNLPPEGQLQAAQHTSRLLPGEYFGALGIYLTNTAMTPAVRRAIYADLLTRPNAIKLPWLIEVAQANLDGQSDEARFLLQAQLREDHGADWNAWREQAAVWLSQHPD